MITGTSYDNADHPSLLTELGWLDIRQINMFNLGIFMFKISRGMTPQSVNNMFNNINDLHHYQTGCSLQDKYFRIPINKQTTKTAISKLWNNIPRSIRGSPSLETFEKRFRELLLSLDKDTFCF